MVPECPCLALNIQKGKYWLFPKNYYRKINVMDKIWDRKSFEVGGHCMAVVAGMKKQMSTQNQQKSNAKKIKKSL